MLVSVNLDRMHALVRFDAPVVTAVAAAETLRQTEEDGAENGDCRDQERGRERERERERSEAPALHPESRTALSSGVDAAKRAARLGPVVRLRQEVGWWLWTHVSTQLEILEQQVDAEVSAVRALRYRAMQRPQAARSKRSVGHRLIADSHQTTTVSSRGHRHVVMKVCAPGGSPRGWPRRLAQLNFL